MSADSAVWKKRFPRKQKITSMHCTSCSAPLRRPCTLGPSPSGSDQSSPNHGRSSVTPGMDFSDLVSGWHGVDVKTIISVIWTNKTYRTSGHKQSLLFKQQKSWWYFLSLNTEQFNEVVNLNMLATGYCLLNFVFQNSFSRYQNLLSCKNL